ncbi:cytochrome c oxidase, subunit VIa [Infundibulicybe gibba]|nr:cytochrome c oxidase, subunit VIa [Infundibulicybe gibba]
MSFISRNAIRAVARSSRSRAFATAQSNTYLAEQEALQHHAADTTDLWRKISYFVCAPAVATCVAWVYNAEVEHAAHINHLKAENDGHLPEIPAYEYMNRRGKPFPWGMNSLFFNPHSNKDMIAE